MKSKEVNSVDVDSKSKAKKNTKTYEQMLFEFIENSLKEDINNG